MVCECVRSKGVSLINGPTRDKFCSIIDCVSMQNIQTRSSYSILFWYLIMIGYLWYHKINSKKIEYFDGALSKFVWNWNSILSYYSFKKIFVHMHNLLNLFAKYFPIHYWIMQVNGINHNFLHLKVSWKRIITCFIVFCGGEKE